MNGPRSLRRAVPVLLLLAVAGCANSNDVLKLAVPGEGGTVKTRSGRAAYAAQVAEDYHRKVAGDTPLIVAALEERGVSGVLVEAAARAGGVQVWTTVDNITFTTREGVLIGTRGSGDDLMSVDVAELLALLRSGRDGQAVRVNRRLNGDDTIVAESYLCEVAGQGPRTIDIDDHAIDSRLVAESCHGPRESFENLYWLAAGRVIQSKQWIGPKSGTVSMREVIR